MTRQRRYIAAAALFVTSRRRHLVLFYAIPTATESIIVDGRILQASVVITF